MVLALNVSVYFCKLLPLHMNGNLPVGIGMHVFAMICDLNCLLAYVAWKDMLRRSLMGVSKPILSVYLLECLGRTRFVAASGDFPTHPHRRLPGGARTWPHQ
eukprot:UN0421